MRIPYSTLFGELIVKRLQVGLRLILLLVALLGTCFAWLNAVRSTQLVERAAERMNLEAKLAATERWRATLRTELQNATSQSVRRATFAQIPRVEAQIAAMKRELGSYDE